MSGGGGSPDQVFVSAVAFMAAVYAGVAVLAAGGLADPMTDPAVVLARFGAGFGVGAVVGGAVAALWPAASWAGFAAAGVTGALLGGAVWVWLGDALLWAVSFWSPGLVYTYVWLGWAEEALGEGWERYVGGLDLVAGLASAGFLLNCVAVGVARLSGSPVPVLTGFGLNVLLFAAAVPAFRRAARRAAIVRGVRYASGLL